MPLHTDRRNLNRTTILNLILTNPDLKLNTDPEFDIRYLAITCYAIKNSKPIISDFNLFKSKHANSKS